MSKLINESTSIVILGISIVIVGIQYSVKSLAELIVQIIAIVYATIVFGISAERIDCSPEKGDQYCCGNRKQYRFDTNKTHWAVRTILTLLGIRNFTSCKRHFVAKMTEYILTTTAVIILMMAKSLVVAGITENLFIGALLKAAYSILVSLGIKVVKTESGKLPFA